MFTPPPPPHTHTHTDNTHMGIYTPHTRGANCTDMVKTLTIRRLLSLVPPDGNSTKYLNSKTTANSSKSLHTKHNFAHQNKSSVTEHRVWVQQNGHCPYIDSGKVGTYYTHTHTCLRAFVSSWVSQLLCYSCRATTPPKVASNLPPM